MSEGAAGRYDRLLFRLALAVLIGAVLVSAGIFIGWRRTPVETAFAAVGQLATELEQSLLKRPVHMLQPARYAGSGVTVNKMADHGDLILLSGFFDDNNGLRLIDRDGNVIASWTTSIRAIAAKTGVNAGELGDWDVDLHGAIALPDGSVVFNYEYYGLVKLSRCGEVDWAAWNHTHHSIAVAEDGGFWVPGRQAYLGSDDPALLPFSKTGGSYPITVDLVLRLSDDGTIVMRKSVPEILYENGLSALLTANGRDINEEFQLDNFGEMVHLNRISELKRDLAPAFPMFEAGDLLLSLRTHNLLLVVDPGDWRIKWYHIGPWQRQHAPDFEPDGTISVFNNDSFIYKLKNGERVDPENPARSRIVAIRPDSNNATVVYGDKPGQAFGTVIRGDQRRTADGGRMIVEFDAGRVFQVDGDGRLVWEYINRWDEDEVLEMTGAMVYPADYFAVSDWACPTK